MIITIPTMILSPQPQIQTPIFIFLVFIGDGDYEHNVERTAYWGDTLYVEGELSIRNESSREAEDVDSDYRIEDNRDFDDNDVKVDEDNPFDIDPYEKITKKMSAIKIKVAEDGQTVKVSGESKSRTFPVINGFVKIYFFADVEEPDGDHHISSESDKDEYAKVELTIVQPFPQTNFTANQTIGLAPLGVNFTDTTTFKPISWLWDFGDGSTSIEQNPSHTYTTGGTFSVTLTAENSVGQDTETKQGFITIAPPPTIRVTNPDSSDNWRCDKDSKYKNIYWTAENFPELGKVAIYYTLDNGATWRTIESSTSNDGSRKWYMCKSHTTDTYGYVKVKSLTYPNVYGISARFYIDHAKGCD